MRRLAALLILSAQALAAGHLALEAHVLAASGAFVEEAPRCPRPHGGAGISHGHARAADACAAAAVFATVGCASPPTDPGQAAAAAPASMRPARGEVPLEILSVAPKGSPPA